MEANVPLTCRTVSKLHGVTPGRLLPASLLVPSYDIDRANRRLVGQQGNKQSAANKPETVMLWCFRRRLTKATVINERSIHRGRKCIATPFSRVIMSPYTKNESCAALPHPAMDRGWSLNITSASQLVLKTTGTELHTPNVWQNRVKNWILNQLPNIICISNYLKSYIRPIHFTVYVSSIRIP
jgi:hypothetical protein